LQHNERGISPFGGRAGIPDKIYQGFQVLAYHPTTFRSEDSLLYTWASLYVPPNAKNSVLNFIKFCTSLKELSPICAAYNPGGPF